MGVVAFYTLAKLMGYSTYLDGIIIDDYDNRVSRRSSMERRIW